MCAQLARKRAGKGAGLQRMRLPPAKLVRSPPMAIELSCFYVTKSTHFLGNSLRAAGQHHFLCGGI